MGQNELKCNRVEWGMMDWSGMGKDGLELNRDGME